MIYWLRLFGLIFIFICIIAAIGYALPRSYDFEVAQTIEADPQTVFEKIDKLLDSIADYRHNPMAILVAFANSFVFYFLAVINVYVTALVFQADVSFADMLIATPIIMLLMNLPISLGNLFLMEASYTGILAMMGYSPALGLSVAVTMRLKSLFDGMLGGVLHPFFVTKRHQ